MDAILWILTKKYWISSMMLIIQQMDFSHTISVQWMASICGCWHELTSPPRQWGVVVTNGGTTIEVQSNHNNICHYLSCDIWRFSMVTFLPTIALFCQTWIGTHDMSQQQKHVIWREYVSHSCICCYDSLVWFVYIGFSTTKPYSKLNSSHMTTKWSILAHICIIHHWWIISHQ